MSATTVDFPLKSGATWSFAAREEIPRNIVDSKIPSTTRVWRAFFHSTGRKAGTPFEIASTPVIAVLPDAKACSAMNSGTPANSPRPSPEPTTAGAPWSEPVANRTAPITSIVRIVAMNTYVGTEKNRPDSRTPRRLPNAMRTMKKTAISTRHAAVDGISATTAATPAETETATVST